MFGKKTEEFSSWKMKEGRRMGGREAERERERKRERERELSFPPISDMIDIALRM